MSDKTASALPQIDLSKATDEQLQQIHSEVARAIVSRVAHPSSSEPHDSHSSNHANNKIVMQPAVSDPAAAKAAAEKVQK